MNITKKQLKKIIKEELNEFLREQEEPDWEGLKKAYYECRNKSGGGNSPGLVLKAVSKHIEKAKSMGPQGFQKLVAYVNKKYPGCYDG